jgi:site-specific recombinase XerD
MTTTTLAPLLQAFFTDRLCQQQQVSPNTVAAYRDAFRLLLSFAQRRLGKAPSALLLSDLDAPLIGAFLDHLELERRNSPRTRNARLAAIHSFFRYIAIQEPDHAALIQRVLAMPQKRFDRNLVGFLTSPEVDALLSAPDRRTVLGRRDHLLLRLAIQTGLRVSELVGLRWDQLVLVGMPHIRCHGKGRKERCTPLTRQIVAELNAWLREHNGNSSGFVFNSRNGRPLSRDAVEYLVSKYTAIASSMCASLREKTVSPHMLRHTTAVRLLQAGVDRSTIALWLGHESVETTQMYLDADLAMKEQALDRTAPLGTAGTRYHASDHLLAFLGSL